MENVQPYRSKILSRWTEFGRLKELYRYPWMKILLLLLLAPYIYLLSAWLSKFCMKRARRLMKTPEVLVGKQWKIHQPKEVDIPDSVHRNPGAHEIYQNALDENGDIVGIRRHGRREYLIGASHVRAVLTDSQSFSFDQAIINMLNMQFVMRFKNGTFVQELEDIVLCGVTPHLQTVIHQIGQIYTRGGKSLVPSKRNVGRTSGEIDDLFQWTQRMVAEAMVEVLLGKQYVTPTMITHFQKISNSIAHVAGIYQNTEGWYWSPWLWQHYMKWRVVCLVIIPRFFFSILPVLWKDRQAHVNAGSHASEEEILPLLSLLAAKHCSEDGLLGFGGLLWCCGICFGVMFASIHQTTVTTVWSAVSMIQNADKYLIELRKEWDANLTCDADGFPILELASLNKLTLLDSFVRETIKTKGDFITPVRWTKKDVWVGGFLIPANSMCVPYVRAAHLGKDNRDTYHEFDGARWHHKGIPTVQGRSDFIGFGLGRWACPGRFLAVAEIKALLVVLFSRYDIDVKEGSFKIIDPMNTTAVAPKVGLIIKPRICD